MLDQEERHERRERWVQNLVFIGMLIVLVTVVAAGVTIRRERRAEALRETPSPTPRTRPTPWSIPTPAGATTPYPLPESRSLPSAVGSGPFILDDPFGELDPLVVSQANGQHYSLRPYPSALLFLGLYEEDMKRYEAPILPGLAQSMDVSPDGLVYTVHLRQDVYWVQCDPRSHGVRKRRQVTADDVLYAYQRLADSYPDIAQSFFGGETGATAGVAVVDPFTVRFTLSQPIAADHQEAYMERPLALPAIWPIPHEPIDAYGEDWVKPGTIWVSGRYCPLSWKPGGSLTVVANPWLPEDLQAGVDEIVAPWLTPLPFGNPASYPTPGSAAP